MANNKSDALAKRAYVDKLVAKGFTAKVTRAPADITAEKDGLKWYFEIKMTRHKDRYFGAATLTAWRQAFKDPEHFRFVVAIEDSGIFEFIEYTPDQFMRFSSVPPFKVNFNIEFKRMKSESTDIVTFIGKKAIPLTHQNFQMMDACYNNLKCGIAVTSTNNNENDR